MFKCFVCSKEGADDRYFCFYDFVEAFWSKVVNYMSSVRCNLEKSVNHISPIIVYLVDAVSFDP